MTVSPLMMTATTTIKSRMTTGGTPTMTDGSLTLMTEGIRIMTIGGTPTLMTGMMTDESRRMMIDTMIGGPRPRTITTNGTTLEVKL